MIFALRCFFLNQPLICFIVIWVTAAFSLGFMLKVVEGPIYNISENSQENYIDYSNAASCYWNVLIAMSTSNTKILNYINII